MRVGRTLLILGAVALIGLLAGCGSDSSGESASPNPSTEVSLPTPTSPIPTTTTASTTAGGGKKKVQTTTAPAPSGGCVVPDAYTDFKYTGLDCSAALAVAQAWDQNGKTCNTVDNPDVADWAPAHLFGRGIQLHGQAGHPLRRPLRHLHAGRPERPLHLAAGVAG